MTPSIPHRVDSNPRLLDERRAPQALNGDRAAATHRAHRGRAPWAPQHTACTPSRRATDRRRHANTVSLCVVLMSSSSTGTDLGGLFPCSPGPVDPPTRTSPAALPCRPAARRRCCRYSQAESCRDGRERTDLVNRCTWEVVSSGLLPEGGNTNPASSNPVSEHDSEHDPTVYLLLLRTRPRVRLACSVGTRTLLAPHRCRSTHARLLLPRHFLMPPHEPQRICCARQPPADVPYTSLIRSRIELLVPSLSFLPSSAAHLVRQARRWSYDAERPARRSPLP